MASAAMDLQLENVEALNVSTTGNLSFEVSFADKSQNNNTIKSPLGHKSGGVSPRKEMTKQEIQQKMAAAEQRRLEQENIVKKKAQAKDEKIAQVQKQRDELEQSFKEQTDKDIKAKLDNNKENKQKVEAERVEKAKREDEKLKIAREQREEKLNKLSKEIDCRMTGQQFTNDELEAKSIPDLDDLLHQESELVAAIRHVLDKKEIPAQDEQKWTEQLGQVEKQRDQILQVIKQRKEERSQSSIQVQDQVNANQPISNQLNQSSSNKRSCVLS